MEYDRLTYVSQIETNGLLEEIRLPVLKSTAALMSIAACLSKMYLTHGVEASNSLDAEKKCRYLLPNIAMARGAL